MNFIQRHRRPLSATLAAITIVAAVALTPHAAKADIAGQIATWTAQLAYFLMQFMAKLLGTVIQIMVAVAQYNDFLKSPAVVRGWVIVRDLANMFFIIVMLIIAFGTILKLENYRFNRLLARLIVMAVLVNFSKFITGFFIDFAQVVMLTFVNAWRDVAAGNIINALGLDKVVSLLNNNPTINVDVDEGAILTAVLLGLAIITIATVVMAIIAIVLIVRILALWFLIILSPLAYLFRTYPATEKYAGRWWSEFGKYVITGPVVAFLLWLSLAIMSQPGTLSDQVLNPGQEVVEQPAIGSNSVPASQLAATITEISQSERLLSYITGIMLLVGTLVMTKELGVAGGQLAGQAAERIKSAASRAAKIGGTAAAGVATLGVGGAALAGGAYAARKQLAKVPGFAGRKFDEWNIRAQQGERLGGLLRPLSGLYQSRLVKGSRLGQYLSAHPISLRPSLVKKAYQEYRHAREEGIYGKAQGGMRDVFNLVTSGGRKKTREAYYAESREVKAREAKLRQGSTRKEAMLEEIKSLVDFKRDSNGKIIGAQIRSGEGSGVQAALHILTQNHDINEVIKDADFGELLQSLAPEGDKHLAQVVGPTSVRRLLSHLFGHHEGAEVAQDLSEIGLQYNDPWLYTLIEMDKKGNYHFIDEEGAAQKDGKNYADLKRYNAAEHGGMAWTDFSKTLSDDEKKDYRDHYDLETNKQRATILAAFNQKRENRRIATLARRQDFAPEVGFGDGNMYFRRELGTLGEQLVRDVLSTMTDYRYASPETKDMFQQHVDVLKAFADSAFDGGDSYKRVTGGVGTSMPVTKDQAKGIYRLIGLILGSEKLNLDDDKLEQTGKDLDVAIEKYHGGAAYTGRTKYAEFQLELNRLIELNRDKLGKLSTEEQGELVETFKLAAANQAGLRDNDGNPVPPKLATPVGISIGEKPKEKKDEGGAAGQAAQPQNPPPTPPAAGPAGQQLRDIEKDMYDATRSKVEDYEARFGAGAFFQSKEYLENYEKYLDEETFNQSLELEKRPISPIGGIAGFARKINPSNMLAFDARSFAGGKFGDRAGHNLTDPKDIREFLREYDTLLQDEYEKLAEKAIKTDGDKIREKNLEAAHERIATMLAGGDAGLSSLQIVNTARVGYSARHVAAHEDTHAKLDAIDSDRSFRRSLLQGMSEQDRRELVQGVRDKMGDQKMSEEEAFDEFLTEGIVNSWKSWADASPDAMTLNPQLLEAIQQQAEKSGQQRFMASPEAPEILELEDLEKSPGKLQTTLSAAGYKTASVTGDVLKWAGKTSGGAARNMGAMAKYSARWTGRQMAKGISVVFGSTIGKAINDRLANVAQSTVKASKVVGGGVAVGVGAVAEGASGIGRGIQRGAGVASAALAVGAQRTRDTLNSFQASLEKRRRDKVLKLEEEAQKRMDDLRIKREQRVQQEKSTPLSRQNWNQQDEQFAKQVADLNTQRQTMIRAGNIGEVARISQQITDVERQRSLARQRQQEGSQYLEDAKREEAAAATAAQKAMAKAEAERSKVFGPKLQTPSELKSGLNPEQYAELERTVSETTTLQQQYEAAQADAALKGRHFEEAKDTASAEEFNRLYQDWSAAAGKAHNIGRVLDAAQDNLERVTKRLQSEVPSQPERRGPTPGAPLQSEERRKVTEVVTEQREPAPTERTERVIEERELPPTERTETVVEETSGEGEPGEGGSLSSGVLQQILAAIEQGNATSQAQLNQIAQAIQSGDKSAAVEVEKMLGRIEESGKKTAEAVSRGSDGATREEHGYEDRYEAHQTTEYLRKLVQQFKEKKTKGETSAPIPPAKGPKGETL